MARASCCSRSPTGWTRRCSPRGRRSTCIIANILAGPLIELAPDFAKAMAPGGTIILAGLLDSQADAVFAAYEKLGLHQKAANEGEWPVLVLGTK